MRHTILVAALVITGASGALGQPPTGDATLMDASLSEYRSNIRTGAAKDGIPSIDDPVFQDVEAADAFLDDKDRVIGVYINGEARASADTGIMRNYQQDPYDSDRRWHGSDLT